MDNISPFTLLDKIYGHMRDAEKRASLNQTSYERVLQDNIKYLTKAAEQEAALTAQKETIEDLRGQLSDANSGRSTGSILALLGVLGREAGAHKVDLPPCAIHVVEEEMHKRLGQMPMDSALPSWTSEMLKAWQLQRTLAHLRKAVEELNEGSFDEG